MQIEFYRTKDKYGYLSNFAKFPVKIDGFIWPTTEHYFQAQKFVGTKYETEIRNADNPMIAAKLGRDRKKPLRKDWEQVKDDVMRKAVLAKFTQHPDLRQKLLETGNLILIEHTKNDSYWGDGGNGTGKNMLGKILMEVRNLLRQT